MPDAWWRLDAGNRPVGLVFSSAGHGAIDGVAAAQPATTRVSRTVDRGHRQAVRPARIQQISACGAVPAARPRGPCRYARTRSRCPDSDTDGRSRPAATPPQIPATRRSNAHRRGDVPEPRRRLRRDGVPGLRQPEHHRLADGAARQRDRRAVRRRRVRGQPCAVLHVHARPRLGSRQPRSGGVDRDSVPATADRHGGVPAERRPLWRRWMPVAAGTALAARSQRSPRKIRPAWSVPGRPGS